MLEQNLKLFIKELKDKESDYLRKKMFCTEHNFKKEAEYLYLKYKMINEIRMEAELIIESKNYKPKLYFND